jgi:hypothetical protein
MGTTGHSVPTKQTENACRLVFHLSGPLIWTSANFYMLLVDALFPWATFFSFLILLNHILLTTCFNHFDLAFSFVYIYFLLISTQVEETNCYSDYCLLRCDSV